MKRKKGDPLKLNLACGNIRIDGFLGVDIVKTKAVDIVWDLTKTPWPWDDNTCDEMFCAHFFEHLDGGQRISFMEETYRILKPESGIKIISPYYSSLRAAQDPTHVWPPLSESSFLYFNKKWMDDNKLSHYGIKCNFEFQYGFDFDPDWATRSEESRSFALKYYINVVRDIHVVLQAKK